jgi:hypothetical protein
MAAVLAAGPKAVLSHRSAAALWQIRPSDRAHIDLTTPRRFQPRPGLHPHRAVLANDEITTKDNIPTTTPARTLLDLAAVLPPHALERALHQAEIRHRGDQLSLDELLERHAGARGVKALRHILATQRLGATITRSKLEDDRARDRMLQAAGWRVVRITWRQLHEGRRTLERELRALLTRRTHHHA